MISAALRVETRPSRFVLVLIPAGVGLVAASLMAWPAPVWMRGLLLGVAVIYGLAVMSRYWHRGRLTIGIASAGTCRLRRPDGSGLEGHLAERWFVSPWLICLGIRPYGRRYTRHVAVFRDAVDPEDFRRLAARLRYPG